MEQLELSFELRPFPPNTNYLVREDGAVCRIGGNWLKPCTLKRGGYLAVSLWENNRGKTWPVHQIVCMTFHGPRPSPQHHAAHHDGNKDNNHASNVRWKLKVDNEADKIRHGTTNRGSRNGQSKLTENQVKDIKAMIRCGERTTDIAQKFNITQPLISSIKSGRIWKHL